MLHLSTLSSAWSSRWGQKTKYCSLAWISRPLEEKFSFDRRSWHTSNGQVGSCSLCVAYTYARVYYFFTSGSRAMISRVPSALRKNDNYSKTKSSGAGKIEDRRTIEINRDQSGEYFGSQILSQRIPISACPRRCTT